MESLSRLVEQVLGHAGTLAEMAPGFKVRQAQLDMALAVAQAIETQNSLIVEAGTGTGKTYAYLVPALLSGRRVLLSTASKTLQDQLFDKDLPKVREWLKVPVTTALLKGRGNYICHFHIERVMRDGQTLSHPDAKHLPKIQRFLQTTQTGDKADCAGVSEDSPVWQWVTSNKDNCLGSECPHASACFVTKARREALDADVVVVNHHLFFADVALKEEGVAELLPKVDVFVFDEAHHLPDIASDLLGTAFSIRQWAELLREIRIEGLSTARDAADWTQLITPVEYAVKDIRYAMGGELEAARFSHAQFCAQTETMAACQTFKNHLETVMNALAQQAERGEVWANLHERAQHLVQLWQLWFDGEAQVDAVRWINVSGQHAQWCESPLDVSNTLAKVYAERKASWIFTSATLSIKGSLSHMALQLGADAAQQLVLESPFDYDAQALLCVPNQLPAPNDPQFADKLMHAIWPLLAASNGGVFVLCTSHRAVKQAGQALQQLLNQHDKDLTLLVQGDAPRAELLERFKNAAHAILVGAASFWEGVDIAGEGLRCVVIDKLPFAPPDDPVMLAKGERIQTQGGNAFMDLSLPAAAIALKQGAGRLIRDVEDWGVLLIGDRRLVDKHYGKVLWRSLPPFRRTQSLNEAVAFMQAHLAK